MISRKLAINILNKNIKNRNLLRHCLAVEAAMKALAKHFNNNINKSTFAKASADKWSLLGLLHDGDWEATQNTPQFHTTKMIEWLKSVGETDKEILKALRSHNYVHTSNNPPDTQMEWALFCSDELTGLIVAATLVLPDKKLSSLSVKSVIKRFHEPKFAAGACRDQIALCEEKLGIKLEDFIEIILKSMQNIALDIGL